MTKNNKEFAGCFEVVQGNWSKDQRVYFCKDASALVDRIRNTSRFANLKTVAIGRIYLKKNNP